MLFREIVQSECSKEVCSSDELHLIVYISRIRSALPQPRLNVGLVSQQVCILAACIPLELHCL